MPEKSFLLKTVKNIGIAHVKVGILLTENTFRVSIAIYEPTELF